MQPQTPPPVSKPVMDVSAPPKPPVVAPAPVAAPLQSVPVKQAPVDPNVPVPAPAETSSSVAETSTKAEDKPDEKPEAPKVTQPKVPHNTPVGLIIVTLLVMAGLSGLAVLIYLNS